MAEKSINDLQREKLEWEIRALKRQARPGGWFTWLLVLLVIGMGAAFALQQPWLGLQAKDAPGEELEAEEPSASARAVELERKLLAVERERSELQVRKRELDEREARMSSGVAEATEESTALAARVEELEAVIADCRALNDAAWEQRAALLETLNEIDALWDALPEKLTFAQLRELQGIEEQLAEIRRILEDAGAQAD